MSKHIPRVEYQPASPGHGLEIVTVDSLFARRSRDELRPHRRLTFHCLVLALAAGTHDVDFAPVALEPGSLLHIRPGQVHRWTSLDPPASVVFFPDGPWAEPLGRSRDSSATQLPAPTLADIRTTLDFCRQRLAVEVSPLVAAALRDLVIAEAASAVVPTHDGPPAYRALVDRLSSGELGRSLTEHAAALGYSERTVSRACRDAAGMTAKEFVDDWVAMEARRRLTDDGATAAGVSRSLGFSEATNFVKFFRRLVGMTPTEWQARLDAASA